MASRTDLIEEIRARADLVQLIGEYLPLRKSGRRYIGLCPFHQEKTPSFSVNPEGQFFYCFGCKAGGDLFDFIMRAEGVDFPSAARMLAERAGVKWQAQSPEEEAREKRRASLLRLNAMAAEIYVRALQAPKIGAPGRAYLERRGLDMAAAGRFRLGYAPGGGRTLVELFRRYNCRLDDAAHLGLVYPTGDGYMDRFRDRLIFPLIDLRGKVVGFGGRVIGEGQPKYLNSPESELFSKGRFLYCLDLAREHIQRLGYAVLVEGYLDAIAAHVAGLRNVVATLGTSLTAHHAELLKRFADRAVIAYDGDSAGQAATVRGLEIVGKAGVSVQVAVLPPGQDPDDLIRSGGAEALSGLVAAALPLTEYLLGRSLSAADLSTPEGRDAALRSCLPILAEVASATAREDYIRQIARRVRVHEDRIGAIFAAYLQKTRKDRHIMDNIRKPSNTNACEVLPLEASSNSAEKELLRAVLKEYPLLARIKQELAPEDFTPGPMREIYSLVLQKTEIKTGPDLLERVSTETRPVLLEILAAAEMDQGPPLKDDHLIKCIARVKVDALHRRQLEVEAELERLQYQGGPMDRIQACQREIHDLNDRLKPFERYGFTKFGT